MENLNAEQVINELDYQTRFAKFSNSNGVLISVKCAQFVLDHAQYYEQRIKELTEENERWRAEAENQSILWRQHFESIYESAKVTLKADTVRKMQERLKADAVTIQDHTGKLGVVVGVGNIDDVAREMLEGDNEN